MSRVSPKGHVCRSESASVPTTDFRGELPPRWWDWINLLEEFNWHPPRWIFSIVIYPAWYFRSHGMRWLEYDITIFFNDGNTSTQSGAPIFQPAMLDYRSVCLSKQFTSLQMFDSHHLKPSTNMWRGDLHNPPFKKRGVILQACLIPRNHGVIMTRWRWWFGGSAHCPFFRRLLGKGKMWKTQPNDQSTLR